MYLLHLTTGVIQLAMVEYKIQLVIVIALEPEVFQGEGFLVVGQVLAVVRSIS